MTKTPGGFEGPKPITKAERDARKAFRQVDAEKAMTEHEIAQKAFSANRERLVERAGLHNLIEGQKISFELKVDPR